MREIKFRAWLKESNQMIQNDFVNKEASSFVIYDEVAQEWISNEAEFILMQFTGLKDRNGKEIYEGDICHIGTRATEQEEATDEGNTEIWFHEGKFLTRYYAFPVSAWACKEICFIEVIGNIYENPELLKEA